MLRYQSVRRVSYFQRVPVGVEHIEGDLDVLLDALAAPLKLAPFQGEIEIVARVTYNKHRRDV